MQMASGSTVRASEWNETICETDIVYGVASREK